MARQCLFPPESASPDLLATALNIILCYTWEAWGSMTIKGWVIQIMREKKNKELTIGQWHLILPHFVWTLQVTYCFQAFIGSNIISSIILRTRQMVTRRLNKNRICINIHNMMLVTATKHILFCFRSLNCILWTYEVWINWWNNSDIMNT